MELWLDILLILCGWLILLIIIIYRNLTRPIRIERKGAHIIKTNAITRQSVWIPIIGKETAQNSSNKLFGEIYRSRNAISKAPYMILAHGFGGYHNDLNFEQIAAGIAMAGYHVVAYDHRCHGKTPIGSFNKNRIKEFANIYDDILEVIDFVYQQPDFDQGRLGVIGFSLGGGVVLCNPLNDTRVKVIVGGCAAHDCYEFIHKHAKSRPFTISWLFYQFLKHKTHLTEPDLLAIRDKINIRTYIKSNVDYSTKVFLVHAKDDDIVPFENFEKNVRDLKLDPANVLVFDQGNHAFDYMNVPFMSQVLIWLQKYL
jgi:acetyl esterase/lipase